MWDNAGMPFVRNISTLYLKDPSNEKVKNNHLDLSALVDYRCILHNPYQHRLGRIIASIVFPVSSF